MKSTNSAKSECPSKASNNYIPTNINIVETPLLLRRSLLWKKKVRNLYQTNSSKVIILWHFVTGITNNIFLSPLIYLLQYDNIIFSTGISCMLAVTFLFSPLAGFLADVKFSAFKVLICSTCIMLVATICLCSFWVLIVYTVHNIGNYFFLLVALSLLAMLLYSIGYMTFIANILQFGTDQLRDAPSQNSVTFLCWYFWTSSLGTIISLSTIIPGHRSIIDIAHKKIGFDQLTSIIIITLMGLSIVFSSFILFILHKRETWFWRESSRFNPYRLVYKVIKYACFNKRPILRSAFTYCEDELPSRMDLGKLRYGGPFTTEQVEDVKVFLRILMILFSLGPAFLMDVSATAMTINRAVHKNATYKVSEPVKVLFLDYGMLTPVLVVVCIPIYLSLVRPFFSRCIPNMLKRMGLGIALLCVSFVILIALDLTSYNNNEDLFCNVNKSSTFNKKPLPVYIYIVQHTLSSLYLMLLYLSAWEFICCQSPQTMKGLLFGLFYAIRGFNQFLATFLILPFHFFWNLHIINCRSGYYILNLCVGLVSLLIYTIVARSYKYRKRDDICNTYQYAERYYSTTQ